MGGKGSWSVTIFCFLLICFFYYLCGGATLFLFQFRKWGIPESVNVWFVGLLPLLLLGIIILLKKRKR